MLINLQKKTKAEIYHLMTQTIVPRPIAWVLSDNGNQSYNLAPFSYFSGVCSEPPLISISIGKKHDKSLKDTWLNIQERSEFVVHIASSRQFEVVSSTAESLGFGDSEVSANELDLIYTEGQLPRLKDSLIALYCERYRIVELGDGPQALVIGEVKDIYIDDSIVSVNEKKISVDVLKLDPLVRVGAGSYAELSDIWDG